MTTDIDFIKLDVQGRIKQMQDKLLEQDPLLPVHLSAIHSALIQYEELVHLLSDEEIAAIVSGQKKHTGVSLIKEVTSASKASISKRIPKATAEDF